MESFALAEPPIVEEAAHGRVADRLRDAARDAVLQMDEARRDGAEQAWKTVVLGAYMVLDHFEHGGRRYVIAVEKSPVDVSALSPLSALSAREREVVAAAAAGRTNKVIAYDLGVAHSTVRVLLARAAKRLNAGSRCELVAIYRATSEPSTSRRSRAHDR